MQKEEMAEAGTNTCDFVGQIDNEGKVCLRSVQHPSGAIRRRLTSGSALGSSDSVRVALNSIVSRTRHGSEVEGRSARHLDVVGHGGIRKS